MTTEETECRTGVFKKKAKKKWGVSRGLRKDSWWALVPQISQAVRQAENERGPFTSSYQSTSKQEKTGRAGVHRRGGEFFSVLVAVPCLPLSGTLQKSWRVDAC